MEAKLIKDKHIDNFYYLKIGINTYATTHKESFRVLSHKNCQAIELGYDLNELVFDYEKENEEYIQVDERQRQSFKEGFQKALEILGDKKFSEEDVLKVVTHVLNELVLVDGFDKQYLFPESIYQETTAKCKSLQQTEWDCIIEMDTDCTGEFKYFLLYEGKPKLDAENCIILKRK